MICEHNLALMALKCSVSQSKSINLQDLHIRSKSKPTFPSDWGSGQATITHLVGSRGAGYYGYLSSQVYSADMFRTNFAKDPMNPIEGRRYRHMVLEKGGSQDEMKTLENYLGRQPNSEAFYRGLGLEAI
jgi:metallopeptidase MepB